MKTFPHERIEFLIVPNDIFIDLNYFHLCDTNNDEIEHDKFNHKKVSKY